MPKRVSRSLLDPWLLPLVPALYDRLPIPRRFPPEGIIAVGHVSAIAGAFGFACLASQWWGGLLASIGVVGNHLADMLDGTHARRTGQCRNGGELLDHFTDPLSFSYWMIGLAVAAEHPWLGYPAVIGVYATAVLTNIRAKIIGEFRLAAFGPTEFKAILALFGPVAAVLHSVRPDLVTQAALLFLAALIAVGLTGLIFQTISAVREVNRSGAAPDATPWRTRSNPAAPDRGPAERITESV